MPGRLYAVTQRFLADFPEEVKRELRVPLPARIGQLPYGAATAPNDSVELMPMAEVSLQRVHVHVIALLVRHLLRRSELISSADLVFLPGKDTSLEIPPKLCHYGSTRR